MICYGKFTLDQQFSYTKVISIEKDLLIPNSLSVSAMVSDFP